MKNDRCFLCSAGIEHQVKDEIQERFVMTLKTCGLSTMELKSSASDKRPDGYKFITGGGTLLQICEACCLRVSMALNEISVLARDGGVTHESDPDMILSLLSPISRTVMSALFSTGIKLSKITSICGTCHARAISQAYAEGRNKVWENTNRT